MDARRGSACYPQSTFYPLSDGPSTRDRRITKPDFRLCSARRPRSQAPFYLYARRPIANRAEGTFGLLRYALGGDRPSQTARQTLSRPRFHGVGLDLKRAQGGISPAAPRTLARPPHGLPPILHKTRLRPISACSEGSWGLSVTLRVRGIFTTTTISPGRRSRQCSSRYAIHAGRNLPDKEFRYLRTVIVTAAVYRGFGRELRPGKPELTPFLNLPTPSRRQTLYLLLRVRRVLCF
jgi:hypothetical protein